MKRKMDTVETALEERVLLCDIHIYIVKELLVKNLRVSGTRTLFFLLGAVVWFAKSAY
jgi:hypothetical protein